MQLASQHILVTRPTPQGDDLCALLALQGAFAYHIPTLGIQASEIQLKTFNADIAIFISSNAVHHYPFDLFPASVDYFAVGVATAMALQQRGIMATQPKISSSEGLLNLPELQDVQGKEIAIFCGIGGRELLYDTLQTRGAHCQRYEVYQRYCALEEANRLQQLLAKVTLDYVICTSGENLLCLEELAGLRFNKLQGVPLVVISERIATIARARGFLQVRVVPAFLNNQSIVQQLIHWGGT